MTTTQVPAAQGDDLHGDNVHASGTSGTSGRDDQSGGPAAVEWVPVEPWPGPPPVPVLAPYLGLVAAVLCVLGGGWLLLAPYALDFRHGAAKVPRTTAVDLETGAAIVAVALVTAVLFSIALLRRLRTNPSAEPEAETESAFLFEPEPEPDPSPEPEPDPVRPQSTPPQQSDPGGALRELLTPLVAALAADLRSHDQEHSAQQHDQHRRQEP